MHTCVTNTTQYKPLKSNYMNKLYLKTATALACGLMVLGGTNAQAQNLKKEVRVSKKSLVQKKQNDVRISRGNADVPQPQKKEMYSYDGTTWSLSSVAEMKYNLTGLMVSQKTSFYNSEGVADMMTNDSYAYDKLGNRTEVTTEVSFDGTNWEKDSRKVTAYDKIRTNLPVMEEYYLWNGDAWALDEESEEGFFLEAERDAQDRVTAATRWLNSQKSIALVKHEFGYGENGPAQTMKWDALNEDYVLAPAYLYENMEWKKSDNQYLDITTNLFYAFDFDDNNVLQSYSLSARNADGSKGEPMANYKATFDSKDRISNIKIVFADGLSTYECKYLYDLDENGSFELQELTAFDDDFDGVISDYEKLKNRSTTTYNQHGDIVLEEYFATDPETGTEMKLEGYKMDWKYNSNGLLEEMVFSYYSEYVDTKDGYDYLSKEVYSDYTGTSTAVEKVNANPVEVRFQGNSLYFNHAEGAIYSICDVQGKMVRHGLVNSLEVSLGDLPDGLYIVKVSGKNAHNTVKLVKK